MASIIKVGDKWRALIRRKGHPSYCKTFRVKAQAEAWARAIESEIDKGGSAKAEAVLGRQVLIRDLIEQYRRLRNSGPRPIVSSSNEHYDLLKLERLLGELNAVTMTPDDMVGYARMRREDGVSPSTVNFEVSKLGTVMRYAALALKIRLPDVVHESRPLLTHLGLIGSGVRRDRRPTEDELHAVLEQLESRRGRIYADIVRFAVLTALRRGEITSLLWSDVDAERRLVLVRNRKDPRKKIGNDMYIPLLGEAWDLLQAQPRKDNEPRIFPVHPQTVSTYFTEARKAAGIPDLRLHDMRHEGTSRLFEQGFQVQQVALVTGHKSWVNLKRYTNLRPEDLHAGPAGTQRQAPAKKTPQG